MPLVPHRFLFRLSYSCRYCKSMPRADEDRLLELGPEHRIDNFARMDDQSLPVARRGDNGSVTRSVNPQNTQNSPEEF